MWITEDYITICLATIAENEVTCVEPSLQPGVKFEDETTDIDDYEYGSVLRYFSEISKTLNKVLVFKFFAQSQIILVSTPTIFCSLYKSRS